MKRYSSMLFSLAIVATLVALDGVQPASGDDSGKATGVRTGLEGRPDAWRYKHHNNQWWYYHPNKTWSTWNGSAWTPYSSTTSTPYAAGYRGTANAAANAGAAVSSTLPATDALPGRSNRQMVGGGLGVNGSNVGTDGRNGGTPNLGGGELTRGGNAGRSLSDIDALPGRSNPQMVGGGIGANGSSVGGAANRGNANQAAGQSATDALPGEPDPQMAGGGLGANGASAAPQRPAAPAGSGS